MKKSIRFYFALFFAKGIAVFMRMLGMQATSMPGSWAIIICPDFLRQMPRPDTVVCITGTNGKTTVANIVEDVLEKCGYTFTCNRSGSNVNSGVASSLIANSTILGKPKNNLAVFEIDERSTPLILPYIKPDLLLCTNIFRDSYKRNAHVEYIVDILNDNIPATTKLILNSDDLICAGLKPNSDRVYFGIDYLGETETSFINIVCDLPVCPVCGGHILWDYIRYHHIGNAHCDTCGFRNPTPQFSITAIDENNLQLHIKMPDNTLSIFDAANTSLINSYNYLSAITLLSEFGIPTADIQTSLIKHQMAKSRYSEERVQEKTIVLHLAKGQNPVACSRAFENAKQYPGKKGILLLLDDTNDSTHSIENISWYYDTDFEFLSDPSIIQIISAGARSNDCLVRLLMAGIPRENVQIFDQIENAASALQLGSIDTVFILYDLTLVNEAYKVKEQVHSYICNCKTELGSQKKIRV